MGSWVSSNRVRLCGADRDGGESETKRRNEKRRNGETEKEERHGLAPLKNGV